MKRFLFFIIIIIISCNNGEISKKKGSKIIMNCSQTLTLNRINDKIIKKNYNNLSNLNYYDDTLRPFYKKLIFKYIKKIQKDDNLSIREIDSIIPISYQEFFIYYSYYVDTNTRKAITKIDKLQFKYAEAGQIDLNKFFYEQRFFSSYTIDKKILKILGENAKEEFDSYSFFWLDNFSALLYDDSIITFSFCNYYYNLSKGDRFLYYELCYNFADIDSLCLKLNKY